MSLDITQLNQLIKQRRSIYTAQYTGEKVPQEVIQTMLENANWAPNHKHTEPWRFKVFEGKSLQNLFSFMAKIYQENTPLEQFKQEKHDKFLTLHEKVSHVIAICMKRDEKQSLPEVEEVCAVACAVQNMLLTAEAHKIGCYWSTGGGTFSPQMKEFLHLGELDKCLGFLYIGTIIPKELQGRRTEIAQKVEWFS